MRGKGLSLEEETPRHAPWAVTGVDVDSRVEGLAVDGEGKFRYVLDDDRIHLRSA